MNIQQLDEFLPIQIEDTQPSKVVSSEKIARGTYPKARKRSEKRRKRKRRLLPLFVLSILLGLYFFFPWRTNLLVLGLDRALEGTNIARSDTMMIVGIQPLDAEVKILSIPRDLWVAIPAYGQNRINTAHYFAESEEADNGPFVALSTVENNFNLDLDYFVRIRLEGFAAVIDAIGGVEITISETVAGLPPGTHQLDGSQALAFVRDRQGDDFFRMEHGQLFLLAVGKKLLNPFSWGRIPKAIAALGETVDSNLPMWLYPRLGFALLRAGPEGIDNRTLDRTMVSGWTTDAGAQVLLPNWEAISPLINELFGSR